MSYLDGPRINFWGGAKTNVDTANNEGHGLVDLVRAEVTDAGTDAEIIDKLRQPLGYYTEAGWNYYGDHQVAFLGAKVSSSGGPGAVATDGDLVGLPVYLLGSVAPGSGDGPYGGPVMVDLDPTSSQTTQIFVGGFQIGGGGGTEPALLVRGDTRCHSHFLGVRYDSCATQPPFETPGSVYGSGTFQVAFPKQAVVHAADVPVLREMLAAPGAQGLVVRFSFFEFMPGLSTDEIHASYGSNDNSDNPSLGRVIGTVGPWLEGEPATCPPGRLLANQKLSGAQGLAWLDRGSRRLTLDLVSALQGQALRQDSKNNTSPIGPNVDYGDLEIFAAAGGKLASTPSLPDRYYLYGGIYDVELDEAAVEAAADSALVVGSTRNGLQIAEVSLRIFGDARNVYLDEVGGKADLELLVRELGGPVRSDTALRLFTGSSGTLTDPRFLDYPACLTVPAGSDRISIPVSDNGRRAGFLALNVSAGAASYFVNFRKYPQDDFSRQIEAGSIPWDLVYQRCLRYFYVLFPAMSRRIPLDDQATISAVAGEILKRISDEYRDTTLYMPLTRALSPGKVALLRAYLEEQQGG